MRRKRAEAAVFAHGWLRWILLLRDEGSVVEIELEQIDRLLNEVTVLVADVLELFGGDAHIECAAYDVAVSGGLEPGVERLTVYLFCEVIADRICIHGLIAVAGVVANDIMNSLLTLFYLLENAAAVPESLRKISNNASAPGAQGVTARRVGNPICREIVRLNRLAFASTS